MVVIFLFFHHLFSSISPRLVVANFATFVATLGVVRKREAILQEAFIVSVKPHGNAVAAPIRRVEATVASS